MDNMDIVAKEKSSVDCAPHPEKKRKFDDLEVNTDNVDTAEEFLDKAGFHDREECIAEEEYDHESGISQQIDSEIFSESEETDEQDGLFHGFMVVDTTEQRSDSHLDEEQREYPSCNSPANRIESDRFNLKQPKCNLCDYVAKQYSDFIDHINSVHCYKKEHECHLCDFCTNSKKDLKEHIQCIHLNQGKFKCYACDYSANKNALRRHHEETAHAKRLKCIFCAYTTRQDIDLYTHIDNFHGDKTLHECRICKFIANRKKKLINHIESVHLYPIQLRKCRLCDHSAKKKLKLQNHISRDHLTLKEYRSLFRDFCSSNDAIFA